MGKFYDPKKVKKAPKKKLLYSPKEQLAAARKKKPKNIMEWRNPMFWVRVKSNSYWRLIKNEDLEHAKFCEYLTTDELAKNVTWWHTPNEGKRTTFEQFKFKVMGGKEGVSDFLFAEARGGFVGLAIEMKNAGVQKKPYKRDGSSNYPNQEAFLQSLRDKGWKGVFAVGAEEAIQIFSEYMKQPLTRLISINQ